MKDLFMRKLTAEQVDALYAFTRRHYVEYYDLQTELVDHLANAIEATWVMHPAMSFDEALQAEFRKFGVFGFMDVVEKRQLALNKSYNRLLWSYFKAFIKPVNVLLCSVAVGFTCFILYNHPVAYSIAFIAIMVTGVGRLVYLHRIFRQKVKKTGKKWLLEETIMRCGSAGTYLVCLFQTVQWSFRENSPLLLTLFMSLLLVLFLICNYVVLYVIPSKAHYHLSTTYPDYNL